MTAINRQRVRVLVHWTAGSWSQPLIVVTLLFAAQTILLSGCTAALWDKETFAHHYRPSNPVTLQLFYSQERKDLLVQYVEAKDGGAEIRSRCYWLEPNTLRVNEARKPHFVSPKAADGLAPVAVGDGDVPPTRIRSAELCAVARPFDNSFTLYSGQEKLEPYKLPIYEGSSRRVWQVLITPFAVVIDATIVGAIIGTHVAPQTFANMRL